MIRTVLAFTLGFAAAKLTTKSKTVEEMKTASQKMVEKVRNASKGVAGAVKEEFSTPEGN